jgi:hypothetical protein
LYKTPRTDAKPRPFYYICQFADNAAQQARELITNIPANFDQVFYPAFSPRWCFMVDGQVTNQGATKILQQKVDDEIFLRLQHREKQGLFYQLIDFVGLRAEYIDN